LYFFWKNLWGKGETQGLAKAACRPRGRENNAIIYYPSDPGHIKPVPRSNSLPSSQTNPSPSVNVRPSQHSPPPSSNDSTNEPSCPATISWCVHFYFHAPDHTTTPIANQCTPVGHISIHHPSVRLYFALPQPGDIVTVNHGAYGRREGLVIGSHVDYAVRRLPPIFRGFPPPPPNVCVPRTSFHRAGK
jgi:hypothetical protein